jgi:hypothetical protein
MSYLHTLCLKFFSLYQSLFSTTTYDTSYPVSSLLSPRQDCPPRDVRHHDPSSGFPVPRRCSEFPNPQHYRQQPRPKQRELPTRAAALPFVFWHKIDCWCEEHGSGLSMAELQPATSMPSPQLFGLPTSPPCTVLLIIPSLPA